MRKETSDTASHGEVNVVFNRPLNLLKSTCYTIETETDSKNYRNYGFVCRNKPAKQVSFGFSSSGTPTFTFDKSKPINSSSREKVDQGDVVSCYSFGKCHQKCPDHSKSSGEIMQLLFKG